jgi:2-polyprenyl-3-methyl-5-hydroxy-6-metoxy-1,4-benzoquinol methylase
MKNGNHVVLGSRMMLKKQALEGGMPLYKFFGNIFLTWLQNILSREKLYEFHTGYRAYRTDLLKNIPFELNADDFHFDTEILLQAFHFNAKIEEIQIPTFYGSEICRVNGIKYALDVVKATYLYRLQKFGVYVTLQYPRSANLVYEDKTTDPHSTHSMALRYISSKKNVHNILDIGCGPGHLAKKIDKQDIAVTGIDFFKPHHESAFADFYHRDLNDLEKAWPTEDTEFDLILMLDVLEHLDDPENFLLSLRHSISQKNNPTLLLSVPNVAFILIRLNLLMGRFNYADRGILDISHKRFFTKKNLKKILSETGCEVISLQGVGVPFQSLSNNMIFRLAGRISHYLALLWPSMFAFQFFCEISVKTTTRQILIKAKMYNEFSE